MVEKSKKSPAASAKKADVAPAKKTVESVKKRPAAKAGAKKPSVKAQERAAAKAKETLQEDLKKANAAAAKKSKSDAKAPAVKKAAPVVRTESSLTAAEVARERAKALARERSKRAASNVRGTRPTGSEKPLTKKEVRAFKDMLIAMRERLTEQVATLRNESLTRDDEVNAEEDGSDAFERLFSLERAGTEQEMVFEIDEALRRMTEGSYGGCGTCEKIIERARLKALPFVKNCIGCQSELEDNHSNYSAIRTRFQ